MSIVENERCGLPGLCVVDDETSPVGYLINVRAGLGAGMIRVIVVLCIGVLSLSCCLLSL